MTANFGLNKIKDLPDKVDWKGTKLRRSLLVLFIFVLTLATLTIDFIPDQLTGIQEGKPSPKSIRASRDIEFVDTERTEALRETAAANIQKQYARDWAAEARSIDLIHRLFGTVRQVRNNAALNPEAKISALTEYVGAGFDVKVLIVLVTMPESDLNEIETTIVAQMDQVYRDMITSEKIDSKKEELKTIASDLTADKNTNLVVSEVGAFYLKPNYLYDKAATDKLRKDAMAEISPLVVNLQKGQIVVREGEIVTTTQVKILKELGLLKRGIDFMWLGGLALLAFVVFVVTALYLFNYQRKIYTSDRLITVLALIFLITIVTAKFVGPFYSFYLIPVGAAAMLTALLFNVEVAIFMVIITSILSGLLAGQNYLYALYGVFTGLFSIYAINNIRHRTDLVVAGAWVTLATTTLALAAALLGSSSWLEIAKSLGWGMVGGISTAVFTIGALPFLEYAFGITTDIKLVELSYANQPLLRELMMKAPGTYNHSIMTGNLAESAAEEIGANPLLARVGAYYHDIGKIKRPLFFVENQVGIENPHDHTNPSLSCLIITSHVKDGVEIAKSNKLPQEIIDIISEHHGTSVVAYFYHKAKENIFKESVCEEDFRYQGRKPSSKEAALVMLADSVEAAARSVAKQSPGRIEQLIKRIVQTKLDDGQLNNSNLTLNEIEIIIKSFTQVLSSLYHTRIEYPAETVVLQQPRSFVPNEHSNL
jgi:putative nucleotidyltransferase with HDIG domain